MNIHTEHGTKHLTEDDLQALTVRFEIRLDEITELRRFFVDGVEVSEAEYQREFDAANSSKVA